MTRSPRAVLRAAALLGVVLSVASDAVGQQVRFDDVIRNLRNPDPKIRVSAVRLLRESKYPEAITPMAALLTDPVDEIQLEAIAAELSFYLVESVPSKRRVALVLEKRSAGQAPAAFELGPLAVWPRQVPAELVKGLLAAVDDENPKVRLEAIYALGTIARAPLSGEHAQLLMKALDHYDPVVRAGAARVSGRLRVTTAGDPLITAINDSAAPVRYAAMRALGDIGEQRAVQALTEQFTFHGKGEGAWSALEALAKMAHPSSVALFKTHLSSKDPFLRRASAEGLGRAGETSEIAALEIGAGNDGSEMVRAAMAFALQKMGKHYVPRLVESLDSARMAPQVAGYFTELGPSIVQPLAAHLQDPSADIRANVATALGLLGGETALAALDPLMQDRDRGVVQAATRAIERIKMTMILQRDFYERASLDVARDLIGKVVVHETSAGCASGVIVETEAYIGESDPACHAAPGPTGRNAPLYGPPGFAYVYLNYGIHCLLNAVTEPDGWPAAVLIRALEPLEGEPLMRRRRARGTGRPGRGFATAELCRGPGNLTRALGISLARNRSDLTDGPLTIENRRLPARVLAWTGRIGIRVGVDSLWRCIAVGSAAVSGRNPSGRLRVPRT